MKGQRVAMASRMLGQALPLQNGEAPLVQTADPSNPSESFEHSYGKHLGALRAEQGGRVISANADEIHVQHDDGTEQKFELMNNFPMNRKSMAHQMPVIGAGERFAPGQLLARSNTTDSTGAMALGANARMAYMPWEGMSFEDAYTVSESFAKKLRSEHMYKHDHEWTDSDKQGKANYVGIFPQTYDKAMLANFDEHGVVKPGTVVKANDPLILVASEQERNKKSLVRGDKPVFKDRSVRWDHSYDGVVTDVVHGKSGVTAVVKAYAPTELADKLCYAPDHDVLTRTGWKPISQITLDDECASRAAGNYLNSSYADSSQSDEASLIEYLKPVAIHKYVHTGRMYEVFNGGVSLLVTDNHELHADLGYGFELKEAKILYGRNYKVLVGFSDATTCEVNLHAPDDRWVEYSGDVHCVTLPRNHVLYVRRDGKPVWCGNSGRHGNKGVIGQIIKDEDMPIGEDGRPFEVIDEPNGSGFSREPQPVRTVRSINVEFEQYKLV